MSKKIVIITAILVVISGGIAAFIYFANQQAHQAGQQTSQPQPQGFDTSQHSIDTPGSLWWIVNKERPMALDYTPPNLVVPEIKLRWAPIAESMHVSQSIVSALESLYKSSRDAGFDMMLISGYRSAQTQKELYDGYVSSLGKAEADRFSAPPGTSEHQTGLVVDWGRSDNECELDACFGDTPEGKWLAAHAHEHGFIIRYPKGKESVVGYMYEPWHLRYVGPQLAAELYKTQLTMEELFGL